MQKSFISSEFLSLDREELGLVETKQKGVLYLNEEKLTLATGNPLLSMV